MNTMLVWVLIVHLTGDPNITTFTIDNIESEKECFALSDKMHTREYRLTSKIETLCFSVKKIK
jgi:hypothetical protein